MRDFRLGVIGGLGNQGDVISVLRCVSDVTFEGKSP